MLFDFNFSDIGGILFVQPDFPFTSTPIPTADPPLRFGESPLIRGTSTGTQVSIGGTVDNR